MTKAKNVIACIDVGYDDEAGRARAACLILSSWTASEFASEHVLDVNNVQPYQSGKFYKRELPCVLAVLDCLPQRPETIVIDGYVWLNDQAKQGLGGYLYDALDQSCIIVGVAKTSFATAHAIELRRGTSQRPLYVTAAGIDAAEAAKQVARMHGEHRLPTALKRVDQLSRTPQRP